MSRQGQPDQPVLPVTDNSNSIDYTQVEGQIRASEKQYRTALRAKVVSPLTDAVREGSQALMSIGITPIPALPDKASDEFIKVDDHKSALELRRHINRELASAREELKGLGGATGGKRLPRGVRFTPAQVRMFIESLSADGVNRESLARRNPEGWAVVRSEQIKGYIAQLRAGRIVETPYVENKVSEIVEALERNKRVFLHGETGGGKTEVARVSAKKFSGRDPKVVRGYKDLVSSELTGHMALSKAERADIATMFDNIRVEIDRWKNLNPGAQEEDRIHAQSLIEQRIISENEQIVTSYVLGAVYLAAKEGRVLIIDEGNTFAPSLLANLNDIMTKRVGEPIDVQEDGVGPIQVKDGFGIIITGNVNYEDGDILRYQERYKFGPDQLDRLHPIEYSYLPQAVEGRLEEVDFEHKQLFSIAIVSLIQDVPDILDPTNCQDKKSVNILLRGEDPYIGALELPYGSLSKLWNLAQFAAKTQEVFSNGGTLRVAAATTTVTPDVMISPRVMISILEDWSNDGFRYELDGYVFKNLVSRSMKTTNRAFLYQLGHDFGFFSGDGWQKAEYTENSQVRQFKVSPPNALAPEIEAFTLVEILSAVFDSPPLRQSISVADPMQEVIAAEDARKELDSALSSTKQLLNLVKEGGEPAE